MTHKKYTFTKIQGSTRYTNMVNIFDQLFQGVD